MEIDIISRGTCWWRSVAKALIPRQIWVVQHLRSSIMSWCPDCKIRPALAGSASLLSMGAWYNRAKIDLFMLQHPRLFLYPGEQMFSSLASADQVIFDRINRSKTLLIAGTVHACTISRWLVMVVWLLNKVRMNEDVRDQRLGSNLEMAALALWPGAAAFPLTLWD